MAAMGLQEQVEPVLNSNLPASKEGNWLTNRDAAGAHILKKTNKPMQQISGAPADATMQR